MMQRRLNLLLLGVLLPGLLLATLITFLVERRQVHEDLYDEASFLLDMLNATRTYTDKEVRPLLKGDGYDDQADFHLPEVPSYASRRVVELMLEMTDDDEGGHGRWQGYKVHEAVRTPMNEKNLAAGWEVELIDTFDGDDAPQEIRGKRTDRHGNDIVFLARPIVIPDGGSCSDCHAKKSAAPASMKNLYPGGRAYGWLAGQVVGADVVILPLTQARDDVRRSVALLVVSLVSIFALLFIVLNAVVVRDLARPLRTTLRATERLSLGQGPVEELDEEAKAEFGLLNAAINRLGRSLRRSIELASRHVGQDEPE